MEKETKKIIRKRKATKPKTYPWLRLMELERQRPDLHPPGDVRLPPKGKVGRPRNPFPRTKVNISLSDDERKTLDAISGRLSQIEGIHRGHIVGLLVMYLNDKLDNTDLNEIKNFTDLVNLLEGENLEEREETG